jgi:penicillin-binding protein 1A
MKLLFWSVCFKQKEVAIGNFKRSENTEGPAAYFRNEITKIIMSLLKEEGIRKPDGTSYNVYTDGLKIYSTLDLAYQAQAELAVKEHMSKIQKRYWEVWKNKNPLTYQADEKALKQRNDQFWKHIRNSERYKMLRNQNFVPFLKDYDLLDAHIKKLIDLEEAKIDLNLSVDLVTSTPKRKKEILRLLASADWVNVKLAFKNHIDIVEKVFNTKTEMEVFDHEKSRKKVVMTPRDSVMYHLQHMQAGLLAIDPKTGFVKAWVGGLDYDYFKYDHCTTYRQIGSTVKPFVYATAIEYQGINPCTYFPDIPYTISPGEGKFNLAQEWKPDNSTETFTGNPYNLYHGLLYSKNSITVKLMKEMGDVQPLRELLKKVGMNIDKKLSTGELAVPIAPSISLGSVDATLFDMVGAYTVFVNDGVYSKPQIIKQIVDREGRAIYRGYSPKNTPMEPLTASITLDMLENNCSKEWKFPFKSKAGGKTGTTNDYVDGWFMGITPNLVVGTWCGGDERFIRFTTIDDGQGFTTARPLFQKFIQRVEKNIKDFDPNASFPKKHPKLKESTNCSHFKIIYPEEEKRLRKIAANNPDMRDSINWKLRVN